MGQQGMTRAERHAKILEMMTGTLVLGDRIAEETNVCIRTIYRDVRALKDAGWKILSGPGKGAGYTVRSRQVRQ